MMTLTKKNQSNGSVFLVDDDASFRKSTARLLALSGFAVQEFASVGEFLIGFPRESKGCLLLDIRMPGSDGMDLLKHLRSQGVELPVVFLTGHGDVPTAVRAMREGAFDLLTKPVEKETLINALENALSHGLEGRRSEALSGKLKERFETLSPFEKEIYRMVVEGLPNKAIAARMGNAERTVKLHRSNLSQKMGAQCVADLVRFHFEGDLR
jgi:FixJ family two-component response regulator